MASQTVAPCSSLSRPTPLSTRAADGPWLAQLAVGYTHLLRGNPAGATTLLQRARRRITLYAKTPPYGIDVAGLAAWARDVDHEAASGPDLDVRPPRLRG